MISLTWFLSFDCWLKLCSPVSFNWDIWPRFGHRWSGEGGSCFYVLQTWLLFRALSWSQNIQGLRQWINRLILAPLAGYLSVLGLIMRFYSSFLKPCVVRLCWHLWVWLSLSVIPTWQLRLHPNNKTGITKSMKEMIRKKHADFKHARKHDGCLELKLRKPD